MRITSFHVDGFGALTSFGEEALAPGVVVIHGPNEAGKSTLFDFLTGVLFGFPQRRDNARFHAPVRGGRHGGRVSFADDSGGEWVVERHAGPQRGLRVCLPDGSQGSERDLSRVLAGASPSLFRAVFAIGTDDLRQLDTLTTDEVRELLFSSSIFGQRRSATRAIKQLSDARDELARPRREDARANLLARTISEVRGELAGARRDMSGFGDLSRRAAEAEARVTEFRERCRAERSRERELELLMTCWKSYSRAESARARLTGTATAPAEPDRARSAGALLRLEPELHDLAAQLSGHRERVCKLAELDRQHERLAESLHRRLALLGDGWTPELIRQVVRPELLAEHARTVRRELGELSGAEATAGALLEEAEAALQELVRDGDIIPGGDSEDLAPAPVEMSMGGEPALRLEDRSELDACRRAVRELRGRMAELDEAKAALIGLGQSHGGSGRVTDGRGRAPLVSTMLAALVFAGAAVALVALHEPAIAAVALVVALSLVAVALVAGRVRLDPQRQAAAAGTKAVPPEATGSEGAEIADRARDEIRRLALGLGLAVPPSKVDVEKLDMALQASCELAVRLEEHRTARDKAEARATAARRAFEAARERREAAQREFWHWRASRGLGGAGTPDAVIEAASGIAELKEDMASLRRIEGAMAGLERSVAGMSARLESIRLVGPQPDIDAEHEIWSEDKLEERLRMLIEMARDHRTLEQSSFTLRAEIDSAEREIDEALGSGERADRLRQELQEGVVLSWQQELDELEAKREALRQAEEEAVREHQSVTEAMTQLATSHRIVTLEQRQAALEDELDRVLDQYLAFGAARALLRRTLSLHERERQPAVIAKAASHFGRVTAGRYVALVPSAGPDGRQAIRAVRADGANIDAAELSRGTIEQLYLCLRLGLADSFTDRAVSLPLFLDDVLVNFDPARARAVATELAASAAGHQIIFFTCHPHLAELALTASSEGPAASQLIELSRL